MGESIFAINWRWEFDAAVAQGFGWAFFTACAKEFTTPSSDACTCT